MEDNSPDILRLGAQHAPLICDCFQRVYGDTYANELFYDPVALAQAISDTRIRCVGALRQDTLLGHMAMTMDPKARVAELGNTIVDPAARGDGLAWKIGDELARWCVEAGFTGYLHYPTTDHHIMQRRSVEGGYETGLMLGYVPLETDGKVEAGVKTRRAAATIVYQPLAETPGSETLFLPAALQTLIPTLAAPTGLQRQWVSAPAGDTSQTTVAEVERFARRSLSRLRVARVGTDFKQVLHRFKAGGDDCLQVDLLMSDPGIETGVQRVTDSGGLFCGWLPGYQETDVCRYQWIDRTICDDAPAVVNETAQSILAFIVGDH